MFSEKQLNGDIISEMWYDYKVLIIECLQRNLHIIAGVKSETITELTGLCERSIRDLKKQLVAGNTDYLFETKNGRGRKTKFKNIESQIIDEIEKGNYQTLQQIADMIHDKFGIKASIMSVSRLLKKTGSAS